MDEPLLTIGAFASAAGLPASALRYYDEVGLLPPSDVDAGTGYRYYTPAQVHHARAVAVMREADVPLEAMRTVLRGDPQTARAVLGAVVERYTEHAERVRRAAVALTAVPGPVSATVRVDGTALAAALRQVLPAVAPEPGPLHGVLVDVVDGVADVVATDRYWMLVRSLRGVGTGAGRTVLTPERVRTVAALLDLREDPEVQVGCEGITVGDRLVAGLGDEYPDHRAVVTGQGKPATRVLAARDRLLEVLAASTEEDLTLRVDGSGITVSPGRPGARAPGSMLHATVRGAAHVAAVEVWFGTSLLRRAVASTVGSDVVLEVGEPGRALVLRPAAQDGGSVLVMPRALREGQE
ncbi:MerR family transcriptional regulator [Xylanimonas oleitrophica]|uniref:MerR family transcriptional regulator n=1 Tax=Xylanimonas oleitrophica TaxID=2607479 RepID=UPI0015D0803D|nr:MerR family transcriptional regulator [Xylanimonas oleitrophica]